MKLLCFDIGGTAIKYGIVENGHIVEKHEVPTEAHLSQAELTMKLITMTTEMLSNYQVEGVGISCAGGIDFDRAIITTAPDAIPSFAGWDFRKFFLKYFKLRCVADNDVNSFSIAEGTTGAAVGLKNYITITVGTGIGGAITINGQLYRGANYLAGEVGRMHISDGRFERLASLGDLIKRANRYGLNVQNGIDLFDLYDNGNKLAALAVGEFYRYLAIGITNLIYIFNPEAFIIGGGISNREAFLDELGESINAHIVDGFKETAILKRAFHKNNGGMIGSYFNFCSVYGEGKDI